MLIIGRSKMHYAPQDMPLPVTCGPRTACLGRPGFK